MKRKAGIDKKIELENHIISKAKQMFG